MGLESRQYYRDEEPGSFGFGRRSSGPWSIIAIIITINLVVFLLDAFTPSADGGLHWLNRNLAIDTAQPWKIWTYLTHGFAHASLGTKNGLWHILGNMLVLFFLGRPVEQRLGRNEFLKFYLIAIVVSGLAFLLIHQLSEERAVVVGASGAVTAVVALFIFMYPKVTVLLMGVIPMPAWLLGVLIVALDISHAFSPDSHIAWQAHMAGAIFGVAYFRLGWNFSKLKFGWLSSLFSSRPKLRVHDPNSGFEKLKEQADEVLAKINEHGEESLTSRERRILNRYSAQLRKTKN